MGAAEVLEVLRSLDPRWASPARAEMLARLSQIYERAGLVQHGHAPALQRCCPQRQSCWARAQHRLQPVRTPHTHGPGENASIFWPWIGDEYRPGGVCVIALNLNHNSPWWSINVEYAIAAHAIDALSRGKINVYPHSPFHYRSMASALAVVNSLKGDEPVEAPAPQWAARAYQRVARVQAVKCVPVGEKSYPTTEMRGTCPRRYAVEELEVLQPAVLLALGEDARNVIGAIAPVEWTHKREQMHRGKLALSSGPVDVLSVPHPNSYGRLWQTGQAELVTSLRSQPLKAR